MLKYITQLGMAIVLVAFMASCGDADSKAGTANGNTSGASSEYLVVKSAGIDGVNTTLAARGKQIFEQKCMACHQYDKRLVGPPLGDIAKIRSAEYILSMITKPDEMIKNNETAKKLFREYMTEMTNQNISMDDAKAIYHHLLEISSK